MDAVGSAGTAQRPSSSRQSACARLSPEQGLCISCPPASNSLALLLSWAGSTHPSDAGSAAPSPLQEALLDPRLGSHLLRAPHSRFAHAGSLLLDVQDFHPLPPPQQWAMSSVRARMELFLSPLCPQNHPAQGRCSGNGLNLSSLRFECLGGGPGLGSLAPTQGGEGGRCCVC